MYLSICKFTTCWFYPYKFASISLSKKRENKRVRDSLTVFCFLCNCFLFPLCTTFFFLCSDIQIKRFEQICAVGYEIVQVLLDSLLNSLCFLWFKQMKTNQGDLSPVSTQFYKISKFIFLLRQCTDCEFTFLFSFCLWSGIILASKVVFYNS